MDSNAKLADTFAQQAEARGYYGNLLTFSLPAGHSCPFALDCLSKADRTTGKIADGDATQFRCYAATQEARHGSVRSSRWHNYDLLRQHKTAESMADLIRTSLKKARGYNNGSVIRVHISGDYYCPAYLEAWLIIARECPNNLFYSYTKALPYVVAARAQNRIPDNFSFTASAGGRADALIDTHNLKHARVVYSEAEATTAALEIDHDDSHAAFGTASFALLLHGTQPKGSEAAKALSALRLTRLHA
jgi:hypothetical protein